MSREIFQPRIKRKEIPPKMTGRRGYLKAREYLRRDFENRCAYCMIHETRGGGAEAFWIDHFKPRSKGGRVNDYNNLYWTCMSCNHVKGAMWPTPLERRKGYRFADPCQEQDYGVHFVENEDGMLVPQTPCGEYHILKLRLNRSTRLALRRERNEFAAHLSEALVLIERLEQRITTVSYPETTDERVIIGHIRHEIELLQAELTVAIPFIPAWNND